MSGGNEQSVLEALEEGAREVLFLIYHFYPLLLLRIYERRRPYTHRCWPLKVLAKEQRRTVPLPRPTMSLESSRLLVA